LQNKSLNLWWKVTSPGK